MDYISREIETDDLVDALIQASVENRTPGDKVLPDLTEAEIMATIKRISRDVEAIGADVTLELIP